MKLSKKLALFILMFNMFITFSAIGLIVPIMPAYLKTFGAAGQALGFIIAIIAFAQFIFSPVAGNLSDRHGRKNLIIFGLILNGLSQIAFGLSSELWMLYLCRFFTGVGSAFIVPPVMAYAADITTTNRTWEGNGLDWSIYFIRIYDWTWNWRSLIKCQPALSIPFCWLRNNHCGYIIFDIPPINKPDNKGCCQSKKTSYSKWSVLLKQAILYC